MINHDLMKDDVDRTPRATELDVGGDFLLDLKSTQILEMLSAHRHYIMSEYRNGNIAYSKADEVLEDIAQLEDLTISEKTNAHRRIAGESDTVKRKISRFLVGR